MYKKYYFLISSLCILILALVIFKLFIYQGPEKTVSLKWKIYSLFPDINPIYKEGLEKFIEEVKTMTDGQVVIEYIFNGKGENKDPDKVFEAVANGKVEMGFGTSLFWASDRIPGSDFWYAIPFGLNARDMYDWLTQKGGVELWRKIYAKHNIVPFPIGDTGGGMGGWFDKEIAKVEDLKGLRIRDSGLSAKVWGKLGAKTELIPASGFLDAYYKKSIDAILGLGPYYDITNSYHKGPKYYYYPGWQEPYGLLSLIINKTKWDKLPGNFQKIIEMACDKTYHYILDRFNISNSVALLELQKQGVKFREFPPAVLDKIRKYTNEILEEEAGKNPQFAEIYRSFKEFKENKIDSGWSKIVEEAVYSDTTVLRFKEELAKSTVARVYQRGNQNVVISLIGDSSFGPGSSEPSPALIAEIRGITKIINENSISIKSIMVEGHTDNQGDPFSNWKLSMARANTVVKLLTDNNGINSSLIRPVFYGDTFPIADNKFPVGRLMNHRVEIVIEF